MAFKFSSLQKKLSYMKVDLNVMLYSKSKIFEFYLIHIFPAVHLNIATYET